MEIAAIQSGLKALGLNPGAIDGYAREDGPTMKAIDALLKRNASVIVPSFKPTMARKLVAAEQLIYKSAGIDPGKIDGLVGPSTLDARVRWMALTITGKPAEPWRDPLMAPRPNDKTMPAPVQTTWPRQAEVEKFFGPKGKNQTTLKSPYLLRLDWDLDTTIDDFSIHEKCHDSALWVMTRIYEEYGQERITELGIDRFGGCLNVRLMRGSNSVWSMHSWGIAIDWYPSKNQLQWGRDRALLAKPDYDVFWRLWTEKGWLSLGKARNFDWMHVQAARL